MIGQDDCATYFDFSEGRAWTIGNYDKKGKLQSTVKYVMSKVSQTDGVWSARLATELKDKKGEVLSNAEYEVVCEDGLFKVDLAALLSPDIFKGFNDMEMEVNGQEMVIPSNLKVGQALQDARTEIKVTSSGIPIMTTTVEVTDRRVEGKESIEIGGKGFDCTVVTAQQLVKAGFMKRPLTTKDFIAEGFGVVRSEWYDKRGKLDGYTELIP
jgi:hypothetical protein